MKTLLLLRHAKSSWDDEELPDHDRPLNKRGKREAPMAGQYLLECGLVPDFVLSSSAKRARKTTARVTEACGYTGEVDVLSELYDAAPEDCISCLQKLADERQRVLLVGHNPCLEDLVDLLSNGRSRMATCAVARIDLDIRSWGDLSVETRGTLVSLWRPQRIDRPPWAASSDSA
ncbi:MAG: histidine phosphatase family protein [Phycisphaerae bacterium]|nr:histidine phosphatase family protein [Phycisphaerae bacterium]